MSSEQQIYNEYLSSSQNDKSRSVAVNKLRHLLMDAIPINVKNNSVYLAVYEQAMSYISRQYPLLSWEVQRQMRKKKRRQARRSLEEQQVKLHI